MELPKRIYSVDEVRRLYRDLQAVEVGGGGQFGSPSGLVVGGGNVDGTSELIVRADHLHALPAFGSTAGTFCQGNDSRLRALNRVWDARVVPSSGLHSQSDEFETDSIANWSDMDEGAFSTSSVVTTDGKRCLEFSGNGNGSYQLAARYKAKPSDAFLVIDHVAIYGNLQAATGGFAGGLAAIANATTAGTDMLVVDYRAYPLGVRVEMHDSSGFTNDGAFLNGPLATVNEIWLAMLVSSAAGSTTITCAWSSDGVTFLTLGAMTKATYAAAHWGLTHMAYANNTNKIRHRHVRVFDGATSIDDVVNGGYL